MPTFEILLPPAEILEALFALALCALLLIRAVLVGIWPQSDSTWTKGRVALEAFFCVTSILVVCFLAIDALQAYVVASDRSIVILAGVSAVVGVLAYSVVAFMARFGGKVVKRPVGAILQVGHVGLLLCAACYFATRTKEIEQLPLNDAAAAAANLMQEHSEYLAVTDAGTQVLLYDIDVRNRSQETRDYLAHETHTPAGAKVIPRADANINANCHGWVFTGGKHLLRGNGVDQILHDNGYSVQGEPAAGDVIVYRSDEGQVLHTGIVSGILLDGTCIIESKWGISGRFLHQAEDQPYGLNYAFYRSERSGHLVTIIKRNEVDSHLAKFSSLSNVEDSARSELQVAPRSEFDAETSPVE